MILVSVRPCPKKEKVFPSFVSSLLILPFLAKEHVPSYRLFKKYIFLLFYVYCCFCWYVCLCITSYLVPSEARSKCQILWNWDSVTDSCEQLGIQSGPSGNIASTSLYPSFFKTRQNLTVLIRLASNQDLPLQPYKC